MTLGASGLDCRMTTVSVCHVVCSQARAFRAAIDARMATAAMAANEVLARVADVASCDLLDFIEATGRACSLSTTSVNRRGPPSLPRAELGIQGPKSRGRNLSRKVRETRSSSSQKRSERGQAVLAYWPLATILSPLATRPTPPAEN